MTSVQIKQLLHNYIDTAEDKKLKAIFTLVQDDINGEYTLSKSQKNELDKRLSDHENGIGRTYTWEETIANAERVLAERRQK